MLLLSLSLPTFMETRTKDKNGRNQNVTEKYAKEEQINFESDEATQLIL